MEAESTRTYIVKVQDGDGVYASHRVEADSPGEAWEVLRRRLGAGFAVLTVRHVATGEQWEPEAKPRGRELPDERTSSNSAASLRPERFFGLVASAVIYGGTTVMLGSYTFASVVAALRLDAQVPIEAVVAGVLAVLLAIFAAIWAVG